MKKRATKKRLNAHQAEIAFVVHKFRKLPRRERHAIVQQLRGEITWLRAAATLKLANLLLMDAQEKEIVQFMNDTLFDGKKILSTYLLFMDLHDYVHRCQRIGKYFEQHALPSGTEVPLPQADP